MKIAYFHYIYGPGTPLNHVNQFAEAARELGHEVNVHAMNLGNADAEASAANTPPTLKRRLKKSLSRYLHEPKELAWNLRYARRELEILRRERPDVALVRNHTLTVAEVAACRAAGVPLILEVNAPADESTTYWSQYWHVPFAARATERMKLKAADRITTVSGPLRDHLIRIHRTPAERFVVNHNGADPERFHAGAGRDRVRAAHGIGDAPLVGFVGSFHPWHGIGLLKGLIERLAPGGVRFMTVGSGQESASFEAWLDETGHRDSVAFVGSVPHGEIPAHVAAFDVALIADANYYVSPLKLFEYMAAERAVVAPSYGPISEVLTDGTDGLLFAPEDAEGAAGQIQRIVDDPALGLALGRAARHTIETGFTWRHNAERVIEACREVLQGKPARVAAPAST